MILNRRASPHEPSDFTWVEISSDLWRLVHRSSGTVVAHVEHDLRHGGWDVYSLLTHGYATPAAVGTGPPALDRAQDAAMAHTLSVALVDTHTGKRVDRRH